MYYKEERAKQYFFALDVGIRFRIFLLFWVELGMHWAGYRYYLVIHAVQPTRRSMI
jgi:hypothetical protein